MRVLGYLLAMAAKALTALDILEALKKIPTYFGKVLWGLPPVNCSNEASGQVEVVARGSLN